MCVHYSANERQMSKISFVCYRCPSFVSLIIFALCRKFSYVSNCSLIHSLITRFIISEISRSHKSCLHSLLAIHSTNHISLLFNVRVVSSINSPFGQIPTHYLLFVLILFEYFCVVIFRKKYQIGERKKHYCAQLGSSGLIEGPANIQTYGAAIIRSPIAMV